MSALRYYLHTSPTTLTTLPSHTIVLTIEDNINPTIATVVEQFVIDYNLQYAHNYGQFVFDFDADDNLLNGNGDPIKLNKTISDALDDREDLFIKVRHVTDKDLTTDTTNTNNNISGNTSNSNSNSTGILPGPSKIVLSGRSQIASAVSPLPQQIVHDITMAKSFHVQNRLRAARDIYLNILNNSVKICEEQKLFTPNDISLLKQTCCQQLGLIALNNEHYTTAKSYFLTATNIAELNWSRWNNIEKQKNLQEYATLFSLLGRSYFGLEQYDIAANTFEKSIKILKSSAKIDKSMKRLIHDNETYLARSYYEQGDQMNRNKAIKLFELIVKQDERHIAALNYYSKCAIDFKQGAQTIPYLLRALLQMQQQINSERDNKGNHNDDDLANQPPSQKANYYRSAFLDSRLKESIGQQFTAMVSAPKGIDLLLQELNQAAENTGVLVFIASTLKDNSGIDAALTLYEKALTLPSTQLHDKPAILLQLIHTYECTGKYQQAFNVTKKYLGEYAKTLTINNWKITPFYDIIRNITDVNEKTLKLGTNQNTAKFKPIKQIFDDGKDALPLAVWNYFKGDKAQNATNSNSDSSNSSSVSSSNNNIHIEEEDDSALVPKNPYLPHESNLLAVLFTVVKIFFLTGSIQCLPALIELLEPLRSGRELHLTAMRNESAYFTTIAQIVKRLTFPLPLNSLINLNNLNQPKNTIYLCGDSHCLSASWQKITASSTNLLIQPKLSTGTKCWHLRPQCRFYTHFNYMSVVNSIPYGSSVVFCFGEIDCREGLLLSVERCKYESMEQGIQIATDTYIKEIERVTTEKNFKSFIHPVPPVLDMTRDVVTQFNNILREKVKKSKNLVYLDFYNDLLTDDSKLLRSEYSLDGTHLHPQYSSLLERELNRNWEAKN